MMVDGLLAKHGKGPLRKLLLEDRGKIDQSLYVFLATYEDSRPAYEDTDWPADNSVTMNKDPKFVGRGSRSAKWVARENAQFMICFELATFKDLDPSQFAAVELSIYNKDEDHSSFLLAFHGGDPSKLAYNDGRMYTKPCYYARITAKKRGWNQIRVEIPKGLIRNAMAEWSKCRSLILVDITSPDGSKTVYIDDVRFARH